MNREIKFRALYEGNWYYQTLEEVITITLAAFRNGKHKSQYTGLKDKNGTEIYEGDIVVKSANGNSYQSMPFEVVWNKAQAGFNIAKGKNHHYEKLGNIYQNAELLKEAVK
jgi:hypothetical protein